MVENMKYNKKKLKDLGWTDKLIKINLSKPKRSQFEDSNGKRFEYVYDEKEINDFMKTRVWHDYKERRALEKKLRAVRGYRF